MTKTDSLHSWGTTLLRIVVGIVFTAHGAQKLFQMTPAGLAGFFGSIGIPFPEANAYFIIALELIGGVAMIAGFRSRLIGALFAATMAVAIVTVYAPNGFFVPNGVELVLTLFAASVTLVLQGAGAFAVDNLLAARKRSDVPDAFAPVRA